MKLSEYPNQMLKALVNAYNQYPGDLSEPNSGMDLWGLAVSADIISREDVSIFHEHWVGGDSTFELHGVVVGDIFAAADERRRRGRMRTVKEEFDEQRICVLLPTPEGIDYAKWLMRPWYRKMWDLFKGDVRTIIVTVIIAVIITILTNWILRMLDW